MFKQSNVIKHLYTLVYIQSINADIAVGKLSVQVVRKLLFKLEP